MKDLPYDVWTRIAFFLPSLKNLCGTSPAFLDEARRRHYREIKLESSSRLITPSLLKDLQNLKDPLLAQRVRSLIIDPSFLKLLVNRLVEDEVKTKKAVKPRLREKFGSLRRLMRPSSIILHKANPVQQISDLLVGMVNVNELAVQIGADPLPDSSLTIMKSLWPTLVTKLRKISISCRVEQFESLISPFLTPLTSLEEIHLAIKKPDSDTEIRSYSTTMHRRVAPFITRSSPTLRELSLKCTDPQDLSSFFGALGLFPHLIALDFQILVSRANSFKCLLSDSSGLLRFLELNAGTLERLRIPPSHMLTTLDADEFSTRALSTVALPHVKQLHFMLSSASPSFEEVALTTIRPIAIARQLKSLDVQNVALSLEELGYVVKAFDGCENGGLKSLKVKLKVLTPDVVGLLSEKLRALLVLRMDVNGISGEEGRMSTQSDFLTRMLGHKYEKWPLLDLGVLTTSGKEGEQVVKYHWEVMQALAGCIPSVRSFVGLDNMDIPEGL